MKTIKKARKVMWDAFEKDPDFKRTYVDNAAMFLYDHAFGMDMSHKKTRDEIATKLVNFLYKEE